eukprot:5348296-Amphidinium_carterae.1
MPAKNDLLATIDTGVLHLSTNEDPEEKKLSLDNMHLQEWYDDDNETYDANELKQAIKEEHDSLQKMNVLTRVQASDFDQQQLKDVIQTKWVIRSRPGGTKRKLKARFVAKGFTKSQHRRDLRCNTSCYHTTNLTYNITTQQPQHIHVKHSISTPQHTSTARHNNT